MQTDPIADMLTRIRNANKALHESAVMPSSRLKAEIARLLKEEGYIRDYRIVSSDEFNEKEQDKKKQRPYDTLVVDLKFGRNRERVITDLKRVSKPGRRVYARKDRLPRVLGGRGPASLSTSNGLITSPTAPERGGGGEGGRDHLRGADADRGDRQGDRQAAGRTDGRRGAQGAPARTVQGQGHPLRGRVRPPEGREAGMNVGSTEFTKSGGAGLAGAGSGK